MSARSYNRGSKAIGESITREQEVKAGRMFDRLVHEAEILEGKITQQQAQIESLTAELEKAKEAYHRRTAELNVLKDELTQANKLKDWWKDQSMGFLRAFQALEHKHQKLSEIVRLALPPDKYHEYRKAVEEMYPQFADKE